VLSFVVTEALSVTAPLEMGPTVSPPTVGAAAKADAQSASKAARNFIGE
jgi:hypothetical protein